MYVMGNIAREQMEAAAGHSDPTWTAEAAQMTALLASHDELSAQLRQITAERNALRHSLEYQLGHTLLYRLPFGALLGLAQHYWVTCRNWLTILSLNAERRFSMASRYRYRVLTTVCWDFPIYSQTFVYQEITQLARQEFDIRLIYSKLDTRQPLPPQFAHLWKVKRCQPLPWKGYRGDFVHYQKRLPDKVEALLSKVSAASGLSRQELMQHEHFLQAFAFTRLVEAYKPHYLHSYFFYERSFMTLVAGYLLDIPRGVSCYADHLLRDYELKVVPLHLELCDVVIATSERIKQELLTLAPQLNPERILVKPNAINAAYFPALQRQEPQAGEPFRLACISRLDPKKGLLYLIDAMHLLRQRQLQVELHVVGDAPPEDPYKQQLVQRIATHHLENVVHLEGRQQEDGVRQCLHRAHLFVAPFIETAVGDKDGIPTALLEAMATGLPAVATDAGSIPEVIEHERDGVLVAQRDPLALANAIEYLLRHPEQRQRLGQEATAKIQRCFDVHVCEERFHTRVRALLEPNPAVMSPCISV